MSRWLGGGVTISIWKRHSRLHCAGARLWLLEPSCARESAFLKAITITEERKNLKLCPNWMLLHTSCNHVFENVVHPCWQMDKWCIFENGSMHTAVARFLNLALMDTIIPQSTMQTTQSGYWCDSSKDISEKDKLSHKYFEKHFTGLSTKWWSAVISPIVIGK